MDIDMMRIYCVDCLIRPTDRPGCEGCLGTGMDPLLWTELFKLSYRMKYCHSKYILSYVERDR